jgi:asparagine synthase (glutamine-hydrolysing)
VADFFSAGLRAQIADADPIGDLRTSLPGHFAEWTPVHRAAWLEFETLLAPYILSAQGDRVTMAHAVETRVPYLDHRIVDFAARLPEREKLRGLHEKRILRRAAPASLPPAIVARGKQPYRAPDLTAQAGGQALVEMLLEPGAIQSTGLFEERAVAGLLRRVRSGAALGTRERQALAAVLSTQGLLRAMAEWPRIDDHSLPTASVQMSDVSLVTT